MATTEKEACEPKSLIAKGFNDKCKLPYELKIEDIRKSMQEFLDFLKLVNVQLNSKDMPRLESFLMQANFSSIVGEFMNMTIPKHCKTLVKNAYHNGHPDLVPRGHFPGDSAQHEKIGIEIKGSRHATGWQGHNAEEVWLMVFHFDSNTPKAEDPRPFSFKGVYIAELTEEDWSFSGRSATSRRTITASVIKAGVDKMKANWVYKDL